MLSNLKTEVGKKIKLESLDSSVVREIENKERELNSKGKEKLPEAMSMLRGKLGSKLKNYEYQEIEHEVKLNLQ